MTDLTEKPRRAVFFDRDGTLIVEKNYLHRIEDFEFIPGVPQALKRLQDAGFLLVVVTNQSGVAREYFTVETVHRLHEHMCLELKHYCVNINGIYFCPHHPDAECDCRKGKPGMILQAADDLDIDLSRSFMTGVSKTLRNLSQFLALIFF
ncbi:HAD family hydrolase, partial [bacterium]|nr:HAD family hydrolase [bacterium]